VKIVNGGAQHDNSSGIQAAVNGVNFRRLSETLRATPGELARRER